MNPCREKIQGKHRRRKVEKSCVTPAGPSTNLTSRLNGMKIQARSDFSLNTHTHWEDQREWHRLTRMTRPDCAVMCVCVCVFFPSILDIKFVGRTSRGHTGGRSHRIFNPPSFCGACLDFCRGKDSAIPFPRRP